MFNTDLVNKFKNIPTPFYYYDMAVLDATIKKVVDVSKKYGFMVHYAVKANTNDKILKTICKSGLGADCVSGNEIKKALEMGFSPEHIVFAGVGKSDEEIQFALQSNILCFNCESVQEIEVIDELAGKNKKTANIALRINPNVDANTHKYITTGLEENKFGINIWELDDLLKVIKKLKNINLMGLHFHIGSQITDLNSFKSLCLKVNEMQRWFSAHNINLEHINVGGGLGVDYHEPDSKAIPDFDTYFKIFADFLEIKPGQKVHFELGRAIVAQCGNLISKVLYIKKGVNTNFAILDAGMTELMRPALYQAYHKIENISSLPSPLHLERGGRPQADGVRYDVVGPICESTDCFGKAVLLPETQRGDLIAIRTTGAYGEVLSSSYNLRNKAKAVYSDEIK